MDQADELITSEDLLLAFETSNCNDSKLKLTINVKSLYLVLLFSTDASSIDTISFLKQAYYNLRFVFPIYASSINNIQFLNQHIHFLSVIYPSNLIPVLHNSSYYFIATTNKASPDVTK